VLVWTPERCPDAAIANIPWLRGGDVLHSDAILVADFMLTINISNVYDSWTTSCPAQFPVGKMAFRFCAAFESGYYALESLLNSSIVPSPYADAMAIYQAYNAEYEDCGVPRGCLGYNGTLSL
jgi:hypothetical protein